MKITIIVEGATERAFKDVLLQYLRKTLPGGMPNLDFITCNGRIPKGEQLKKLVNKLLSDRVPSEHVIALTDVYTGSNDFTTAEDAKDKMRQWVGNEKQFTPHVALHDFEAWLLPYWDEIQRLSGHNKGAPGINPEMVNHGRPPAKHIKEMFEVGPIPRRSYSKTRDALRILRGKDLGVAIAKCSELKALVNTIVRLAGGTQIC